MLQAVGRMQSSGTSIRNRVEVAKGWLRYSFSSINPAFQPNSVSPIHVKTIWFCIPKQQAVPVLSYWAHVLFFSRVQWCIRSSRKRSVQQCGHLAVLSKVLGTNTATQNSCWFSQTPWPRIVFCVFKLAVLGTAIWTDPLHHSRSLRLERCAR